MKGKSHWAGAGNLKAGGKKCFRTITLFQLYGCTPLKGKKTSLLRCRRNILFYTRSFNIKVALLHCSGNLIIPGY